MSEPSTMYRCVEGLRLTDFRGGRLELVGAGVSVPATEMARKIAVHFEKDAHWADFALADVQEAKLEFQKMKAAGIIGEAGAVKPAETSGPEPERPVQTMFGAPFRALADIGPGEIVFLGAPIDIGTTGIPGARFGPDAIRSASLERYRCRLDVATGGMIAWNVPSLGGAVLGGAHLSDAGNVVYAAGEPQSAYYDRLSAAVRAVFAAKGFPVILGGDHSITYSTVPDPCEALVHLDAHCDLAPLVTGHCHHHGNVLTRLLSENRVGEVHHFGLRDTSGWDTVDAGTFGKSVGDLERPDWTAGIDGKEVFVSLDVDVLDPGILPGTGTPVIGGLTLRQLCQALSQIIRCTRPVGLDLVELCPTRDRDGLSARVAIEALLCFLAVYHEVHVKSSQRLAQ
ncbi:MAG: arginase family protein [Rhodobacter sp.]|nr:arginase family protein [Rhodobacter sp.]